MQLSNAIPAVVLPISAIGLGVVAGQVTSGTGPANTVAKGAAVAGIVGGLPVALMSTSKAASFGGLLAASAGVGLLLGFDN